MKFKIFAAVTITSLAFVAMAQTTPAGSSQYGVGQGSNQPTKGFTAGLNYSNLTDITLKAEVKNTKYGNLSATEKAGTSIGLVGLAAGYADKYAFGSFGVSGQGTIYKGLDSGAVKNTEITVFKIQGDLLVPITDQFTLSGGLNVSKFNVKEKNSSALDYDAGGGLQAGINYQIQRFNIMAGSQLFTFSKEIKNSDGSTTKLDAVVNGFVTQVSYLF